MPAVGDPVLAADLLSARLISNFDLAASSTTLQNVTGLSVSVPASMVYAVTCVFYASNAAGTTEDIKYGFSFPSGASLIVGVQGGTAGGVSGSTGTDVLLQAGGMASGSSSIPVGLSTSVTVATINGLLIMSSTAGTFQVMAAQNTSGLNVSTVINRSYIVLTRVA